MLIGRECVWLRSGKLFSAPARPIYSHKFKFRFLNGNLMVPAGYLSIFSFSGDACGGLDVGSCSGRYAEPEADRLSTVKVEGHVEPLATHGRCDTSPLRNRRATAAVSAGVAAAQS